MGIGDDIMATGYARRIYDGLRSNGTIEGQIKICFGPEGEKLYWSEVFKGSPLILQRGDNPSAIVRIPNYPGNRPYIDYPNTSPNRFAFKRDYRAHPGELFLEMEELEAAKKIADTIPDDKPLVFFEPHVKGHVSGDNKAWPLYRWPMLVERLSGYRWIQLSQPDKSPVEGSIHPSLTNFRLGLALLQVTRFRTAGMVTTDGGWHHAAAAMAMPAVVIWTGYSSPVNLGYPTLHSNIMPVDGDDPCGRNDPCPHCREGAMSISVDLVAETALDLFESGEIKQVTAPSA